MDKYLEAEKRLAELLGHKNLWPFEMRISRGMTEEAFTCWMADGNGDKISGKNLPRWCRDWSACGPLIATYQVEVEWPDECYTRQPTLVRALIDDGKYHEDLATISDHPDRDTAVRYCIVQAVIAKLEANNV